MSSNLYEQVYRSLNMKDTEELVEIWQTNDRVEWSQTAFDAIQDILQERLGELPPQDEPILEYTEDYEDKDINNDFDFQIDDENLPEFYDPYEVLRLENWLIKATIAAIIAFAVSSLIALPQTKEIVLSYFMGNPQWNFVAWLIAIVIVSFLAIFQSIVIYFPLKALGSILKILMEMEFRSRGAVMAKKA